MEDNSELDHHFDLDPTTIWSEFPDAPAPPPLLAAGYGLSAPPSYDEFPPRSRNTTLR
ncbi:hypothetical protein N7530_009748 [Penicillium desertorum]|uniref:Uncharacterized protein n=1 Tax=Penicillium desertorum TaxID=1303715 RepID=A0A9W9WJ81_9EURO|nr:hypothetical protein N7530_009748 [Penicillium desertorum]